jgi:dTDP-4-amino-4,6-dideoxygalactose transaminase
MEPVLQKEIMEALGNVLASGRFVLGAQVQGFESAFAKYCGISHCVTVASGTDALELGLKAVGVRAGSLVATVANAGGYSTAAILACGARPLYVDVDDQSLLMDADALEHLLNKQRADAIVVTHLYGLMADMPRIMRVATDFGVPVVEDCAQAHGASLNGRKAGTFGAVGCFSFYPTKNLGALGDGGAIVTGSAETANQLRLLRQYGWSSKYNSTLSGGRNSRLDEIQASVLRHKLPYLDDWNQRRRKIAETYSRLVANPKIICPRVCGPEYVAHLYVVRTRQRDSLRKFLRSKGIYTDVHYPFPDYGQRAYRDLFPGVTTPVAERACAEVLSLPCFPALSDDEILAVIAAINIW